MDGSTRVSIGGLTLLAIFLTPHPAAQAQHLTDAAAAKAADKCQKALLTAGGTFVARKLSRLDKCVDGLLKCVQSKPGDLGCRSTAVDRCNASLSAIAREETRLLGTVVARCDALASADLLAAAGIFADRLTTECADEFSTTPLTDIGEVGTCLVRHHECRVEELFDVESPRSRELLDVAGVTLSPTTCLIDRGGTGADVGNADVGKSVERCVRAVKKAGRTFATTKLRALSSCVRRVFTCVQRKQEDPACITKAGKGCTASFARVNAAAAKLAPTIDKSCSAADVSINTLRDAAGANWDALAGECAGVGVPSLTTLANYESCVLAQHACHAEALLRFAAPRAPELLAAVGGSLSTACPTPGPVATATPTAVASATPTQSPTPTATATPTDTATPSATPTATETATPSPTVTEAGTPTVTATPTASTTATATESATPTASTTATATESATPTASTTATATESATPTETITPTPTVTESATPSVTATPTESATATPTESPTATATATPTETITPTPTATETATPTETATGATTPTETATPTETPTATATPTPTATSTPNTDFSALAVACYNFESGALGVDSCGANDLTNVNVTSDVDAQWGTGSAAFDSASEQYLSCTTANCSTLTSAPAASDEISIVCWVKPSADINGAFSSIFAHETDSNAGWAFFKDNNGFFATALRADIGGACNGGLTTVTSGTVLTPGNWFHVAMTSDNTTLSTYVNAGTPATAPYTSGICDATAVDFTVGAKVDVADPPVKDLWDGSLDECAVFDFALTAQEICQICRFGLDGQTPDRGAVACGNCTP